MKCNKTNFLLCVFIGLNIIFLLYTIVIVVIYGVNPNKFKSVTGSMVYVTVFLATPMVGLSVWSAIVRRISVLWLVLAFWILTFIRAFIVLLTPESNSIYKEKDLDNEFTLKTIEELFKCCNKNGPSDYTDKGLAISKGCYDPGHYGQANHLHEKGCIRALKRIYRSSTERWSEISLLVLLAVCNGLLIYFYKREEKNEERQN